MNKELKIVSSYEKDLIKFIKNEIQNLEKEIKKKEEDKISKFFVLIPTLTATSLTIIVPLFSSQLGLDIFINQSLLGTATVSNMLQIVMASTLIPIGIASSTLMHFIKKKEEKKEIDSKNERIQCLKNELELLESKKDIDEVTNILTVNQESLNNNITYNNEKTTKVSFLNYNHSDKDDFFIEKGPTLVKRKK